MATISQALAIAVQHHQAGQLQVAEQIYRQILAVEPNQPDALHLLGALANQAGRHEAAIEYLEQAIALSPYVASYHLDYGIILRVQEKLDEAVVCYRRALELEPAYAEVHNNLGNVFREQGKLDEAIACYRRALELRPDLAEAHYNLGNVFANEEKLDEAAACYHRVLQLKPNDAEAHYALGFALQGLGKLDEAVTCYHRALALKPDFVKAHNNLGNALSDQGKSDEARASYHSALELNPDYAEVHYNLGNLLRDQGSLDEAAACYRRALKLKPDCAEAQNNLGNVLKDEGKLNEALTCYRRALELKPEFAGAHSNVVYSLNFCPGYDAQAIHQEHLRWNRQYAEPLTRSIRPHGTDRSAERRLRVGYLSPDFRGHPVGRFLLPLLETHDHGNFEIFCYASQYASDEITDRCRACADVWRNVVAFSDEQLAEVIRQDRIDILVDLTMHMANNRLLVFARKPAPVQVTYLAYCGTTGLGTMDYRLTDPYLDPPGQAERFYCEQSVWLPQTYWCYRPVAQTPPVSGLPALHSGHVTFGSLNNFCKVTDPTLATWSRLLKAVPGSRLLLHAHAGSHRERVRDFFAHDGVSPERVTFVGKLPMADYFRLYDGIDIALDPFPYGGGTTTCDALWMGVPVVSLAGRTAVGRGGLSILSNVGTADLVAQDADQYVQIAVDLASDLARVSELRATLRDRMQTSTLMDAPRFARNIEAAYRMMWRRWCAK